MNTRILPPALAASLLMSGTLALATEHHNPCAMHEHANPCAMHEQRATNPCHPRAMEKHANPCAMSGHRNPCSMSPEGSDQGTPRNPCSMKKTGDKSRGTPGNRPIRPHAFDNFGQAVAYGGKLWHDESLGSAGVSCASCHSNFALLHFERNRTFPHFVNMVGDVVTLDQMINYCMLNPMKGKAFDPNAKELTALAAYFRAYRIRYLNSRRR